MLTTRSVRSSERSPATGPPAPAANTYLMVRWPVSWIVLVIIAALPGGSAQSLVDAPGPCHRPEESVAGAPLNVELVTVTEDSFTVTWMTCDADRESLPSDTTVAYGSDPDPSSWTRLTIETDTAYHHATIDGLEEGKTYFYQVFSNGLPGRYDRYHPGVLTTLTLPEGDHLFTFAVLADTHIGETVSGLATSSPFEFPPSYRADQLYPSVMTAAAIDQAQQHGISLAIFPADLTSHGRLVEMRGLEALLEDLEVERVLARGAHDRPNQYTGAGTDCPPDGDCLRHVFFPDRDPGSIAHSYVHPSGFRFIALDSANLSSGQGELPAEQLEWLEEELEIGDPSFILFHHPVSEWSTTLAMPPVIFGVRQDHAQDFLELIGRYDVRAVFTAHTHRNWISYSPHTGRMPILETGPVKEYPGGFTIVRVFEDGFALNFHRLGCDFCREWVHTTRWEYLGRYPDYMTGSLRDRSFTHRWTGPDVPGIPSLPFNFWPPGLAGTA